MEEEKYSQQNEIVDGKRLVKKMQRSRQVRQGRKRQNAFRSFMCLFVNIILIVTLVYAVKMPQWYLDKNIFTHPDSATLEILNNNIVSTSKILAALKSEKVPDVPIYMAKTKNLEDKLMQFAPIEEVYIRRYAFPARLQIIVREREPFVSISPDVNVAPIAFFTRDGKLIGREYLPLKKEYKTLKVLSYGNKGDDYSKWDVKKLLKIDNLAKYIETYSKESVEYVDLRNPEDVYVKIKSVNIRLGRLDENAYERIKRIPSIIPQIQLMDSKIKYLDLRWEDTNYLKLDE